MLLEKDASRIAGQTYNAGYQNHKVSEIAEIVRSVASRNMPDSKALELVTTPSDDIRSYHISSEKIRRELGFVPKHTIEDAADDLCKAFASGKLPNSMTDSRYYNIKRMQEISLT